MQVEGTVVFIDDGSETSRICGELLRVLQEREVVVPVGGTEAIKVRDRVLRHSNGDLGRSHGAGALSARTCLYAKSDPSAPAAFAQRRDDIPLWFPLHNQSLCRWPTGG